MPHKTIYLFLSALFTLALAGCSGAPGATASSGGATTQTISISVQPASQTVPLGATATFSVRAIGSGLLSYQWTRNGSQIAGATSANYTTAALTASDSGTTYQVVVKDVNGSLTSETATLSAGPRSPQAGDLRLLLFQQATATGLGASSQASSLATNSAVLYPGAVGSPLGLGSSTICKPGVEYGCGWNFFVESLPTTQNGLTMLYQGRDYGHFASDLSCIEAANVVVHSIDLEPANNAYAMAWVSTFATGGFDQRLETVAPNAVTTAATQDGNESRVITAVSFDENGQAGYMISAFGGNDANGYLLVGTRVQGDTIARTLAITTPSGTTSTSSAVQSVYSTPVIRFTAADGTETLISEY